MTDATPRDLARFWAKVNKTDTCWLWTASRVTGGYGAFSWDGRTRGAHRFAYLAFVGPVPEGMEPDHVCDERLCVRPNHLQLATKALNQQNRRRLPKNNTSGYRGVIRTGQTSWRAVVQVNGERHTEGPFYTAEAANLAAVRMRKQLMTNNLMDRAQSIEGTGPQGRRGCALHGFADGYDRVDKRGHHWKCRICGRRRGAERRAAEIKAPFL